MTCLGRESNMLQGYSTIHNKASKITTTLETQADITLESDSGRSANWKDQMFNMMKDLREFIMIDVKYLMHENIKEFMREMAVIIRNDIKATMKESMNTTKDE